MPGIPFTPRSGPAENHPGRARARFTASGQGHAYPPGGPDSGARQHHGIDPAADALVQMPGTAAAAAPATPPAGHRMVSLLPRRPAREAGQHPTPDCQTRTVK